MIALFAFSTASIASAETTVYPVMISTGGSTSAYLPQTAKVVSSLLVKGGTLLHLSLYCATNDKDALMDVQIVAGGEKYLNARGDVLVWFTSQKTGNEVWPGTPAFIQQAKAGNYSGRCD